MSNFPNLLAPLRVGHVTLANRMAMGAMHTRLETLDRPVERMAAYYGARARGEIGLILTGGYAPVPEGVIEEGAPTLTDASQLDEHRAIVQAVHAHGSRIVMQILHAGRYAKLPSCVAPSAGKARINAFAPHPLTVQQVWKTVDAYAKTADLARQAGYDGVEVMGSEGYLINEFTSAVTNQRDDEFGGSFERRVRFPLEIVRAIRERVGPAFVIVYRISSIDLIDGGMNAEEIAAFARMVEAAGADLLNTGIGWHESAVPTIAATVPRAAWRSAVANVKRAVSIPVMASNRINTPDIAEELIASGVADLVSMARPLLADPEFARKVRLGATDEINTCIACNQACLDRIFTERVASCLVNPRAGREIEYPTGKAAAPKRVAVVGGGPAGMAFAVEAAQRGHRVTLFEASGALGGQLNMARAIPGKQEFDELLRYFDTMLRKQAVEVRLGREVAAQELVDAGYDEIVLATGARPRIPAFPGVDHPKVLSYVDVLAGRAPVGERVAIVGAGGIGFDVAEFLLGDPAEALEPSAFFAAWGVDPAVATPGGLAPAAEGARPRRTVHMFQRKPESLGRNLGKSTGWILKAKLRRANVAMTAGATYLGVDDEGLHYAVDGKPRVLAVDNVVLCAGQEENRSLYDALRQRGLQPRLIGGADEARELDAVRAIEQATRVAVSI